MEVKRMDSDYGVVKMNIEELLEKAGISKNKICKDLDLPRPNFNKYCRNQFQRIDANLIAKLCFYLSIRLSRRSMRASSRQAISERATSSSAWPITKGS